MQVREIMTENPVCCSPDVTLTEVARLMKECDCGEIPVAENGKPIGVITDRDITCRAVAEGRDPREIRVREIMSSPVLTVTPDMSIEQCCQMMERTQIRRVPVVNQSGECCGIVAQADIAHNAPAQETANVIKDVSRPTPGRSRAS